MNEPNVNGRKSSETTDEMADESAEDVRAFLKGWRDSAADPAAKTQLLSVLHAEAAVQFRAPVRRTRSLHTASLVMWSQTRIFHKMLWIASALVIALGALVTLALRTALNPDTSLPLTIVAPLVAAFGVALLYGTDADPAVELVLATPISPRLIMLARLVLVFGFNLLLTMACSIVLSLYRPDLSLLALILDWLAPMTLLSGLAFLLSALLFDPLASALISLFIWVAAVARHHNVMINSELLEVLPDLLRNDLQILLLVLGLIVYVLAFLRIQTEERWMASAG